MQESLQYLGKLRLSDYPKLMAGLPDLSEYQKKETLRALARTDLYFLLRYLMNRKDAEHPWIFERCREVQASPDGYLDLWSRGHYKSTIITFAKTIQDILASHGDNPLPEWEGIEPTFSIFSHTRPIAKAFLRQIMLELEYNRVLVELFPDVLFAKPKSESPKWSEDMGMIVKRRANPKEATIEASGLVDGQPTSRHYNVLIYDDVVTRESVTTPDMIRKTTDALALSFNLGDRRPRKRFIGTRYAFGDTYHDIMERGIATPRLHPATEDGELTGPPVFLTREELEAKIQAMGPYVASAQLMQNPIADSVQTIRREWLQYHETRQPSDWTTANRALLVDPANDKKRTSDYTAMAVVAKGPDGNLYLLDAVRDRLNLQERCLEAIRLHRKWKPQVAGWERYGKDADIQYLKEVMGRENYRFAVTELGGRLSKTDRINRLIPYLSEGRFWLPVDLWRTLHDNRTVDLVQVLVEEEMMPWPVPVHDDLLDAISRIEDIALAWPRAAEEEAPRRRRYGLDDRPRGSWMSA